MAVPFSEPEFSWYYLYTFWKNLWLFCI